jgi:hypothetical protein
LEGDDTELIQGLTQRLGVRETREWFLHSRVERLPTLLSDMITNRIHHERIYLKHTVCLLNIIVYFECIGVSLPSEIGPSAINKRQDVSEVPRLTPLQIPNTLCSCYVQPPSRPNSYFRRIDPKSKINLELRAFKPRPKQNTKDPCATRRHHPISEK